MKIKNIFKVDRFAEIYKKYNFIGFLNKLNCFENGELWVNGFEDFVQGALGVNYRYPLTEIGDFLNKDREIYLKRKFIILHNGDSYNLYTLQGLFVSKIRHYVKGDFPQFFYTRVNETDVINILLYKNDVIEFKTILIVNNKVKEKRTEYLDRKVACEKLFELKDKEFFRSTERTNFMLTIHSTNSVEKNDEENEEVCLTKRIYGVCEFNSSFHYYGGKYYAAYVKNKDVFHINELEEIEGNPWDCDSRMFFENRELEHRMQYYSELNKRFIITERMKIENFCISNSNVTCVLWHKNAFFTVYTWGNVIKHCVKGGLSNGVIFFSENLTINTAVIYKEFLLLGTSEGIQVVDINDTLDFGELFEDWEIKSMVLENDILIFDRERRTEHNLLLKSVCILDLSRINLIV